LLLNPYAQVSVTRVRISRIIMKTFRPGGMRHVPTYPERNSANYKTVCQQQQQFASPRAQQLQQQQQQQLNLPRQSRTINSPDRQPWPYPQDEERQNYPKPRQTRQVINGADSAQPSRAPTNFAPQPRRQSFEQSQRRQSRADPRDQRTRSNVSTREAGSGLTLLQQQQQQQQSVALVAQPRRQEPRRKTVGIMRSQMWNKQVHK
jgi:hypothetical protein